MAEKLSVGAIANLALRDGSFDEIGACAAGPVRALTRALMRALTRALMRALMRVENPRGFPNARLFIEKEVSGGHSLVIL